MMKFVKSLFSGDHFFWDLYEAEHSPDSRAMTDLFEIYSKLWRRP